MSPSMAVVLANILGYFDPFQVLVQNGIKDSFIRRIGINPVSFVDGPSDRSVHESLDWGRGMVESKLKP